MIEIPSDLHPDLVPLAFLLGNWAGAGVSDFPGAEKCNFGQEVTFSHDGRLLAASCSDGHAWLWVWRPADVAAQARERAGRGLTAAERATYLPE